MNSSIKDINQDTKQLYQNTQDNNSQNVLKGIIKELSDLYNEEISKGKNIKSILNMLEQFLIKKKQNPDEIFNLLLNDQTNPTFQNIIANCYLYGKWVEWDENKAFIFYQKSAKLDNSDGMFHVGNCYLNGIGIEEDEHNAFVHYQKSAEMKNSKGMASVGYCYQKGIGTEKDDYKAFIYYQKSAEMGCVAGIYNVGNCYQNGIGTKKDENKAFILI